MKLPRSPVQKHPIPERNLPRRVRICRVESEIGLLIFEYQGVRTGRLLPIKVIFALIVRADIELRVPLSDC